MGKVNRREFFEELIDTQVDNKASGTDKLFHKYANKKLPTHLAKTTSGLNPYSGPWTETQVIHLLRRTTFGLKTADITTLLALTPGPQLIFSSIIFQLHRRHLLLIITIQPVIQTLLVYRLDRLG